MSEAIDYYIKWIISQNCSSPENNRKNAEALNNTKQGELYNPIQVIIKSENKYLNCVLSFGYCLSLNCNNSNSKIIINWRTMHFSYHDEKIPVFALIKKTKKCIKISDEEGIRLIIYTDRNSPDNMTIIRFLDEMRENAKMEKQRALDKNPRQEQLIQEINEFMRMREESKK